jgi:hypothetical protein
MLFGVVPADFTGSTGVLVCGKHAKLIVSPSEDPPPVRGWPKGSWTSGISVAMPHSLLRNAYKLYERTGRRQTVDWSPGVGPVVVA